MVKNRGKASVLKGKELLLKGKIIGKRRIKGYLR